MPRLVREVVEEIGPQQKENEMGLFATRNNDGASGLCEPNSTVSKKEMERLHDVATRHNPKRAELWSEEGVAYAKAHRIDKAGEN